MGVCCVIDNTKERQLLKLHVPNDSSFSAWSFNALFMSRLSNLFFMNGVFLFNFSCVLWLLSKTQT